MPHVRIAENEEVFSRSSRIEIGKVFKCVNGEIEDTARESVKFRIEIVL